jgi:hypothetical protein
MVKGMFNKVEYVCFVLFISGVIIGALCLKIVQLGKGWRRRKILVVTYEFEHRHHQLHNQAPTQENNSGSGSGSGSMDLGVFELTLGGN